MPIRTIIFAGVAVLASAASAQSLPIAGALCSDEAKVRITATTVQALDVRQPCTVSKIEPLSNGWLYAEMLCRSEDQPNRPAWTETMDFKAGHPAIVTLNDGHEYQLTRCD